MNNNNTKQIFGTEAQKLRERVTKIKAKLPKYYTVYLKARYPKVYTDQAMITRATNVANLRTVDPQITKHLEALAK